MARLVQTIRPCLLAALVLVLGCGGGGGGGADVRSDAEDDATRDVTVAGDVRRDAAVDDAGERDVAADSDAVSDGGGDALDEPDPATDGYPADELLVRIVDPSATGAAAVATGLVQLRGVLFGHVDALRWETSAGASGVIAPAAFWTAAGTLLSPGDNVVTVTAEVGGRQVSDTVVVTYNPSFTFESSPQASPPVLFADVATPVTVTVALGRATNFDPTTVALREVGPDRAAGASLGILADDGDVVGGGGGDEIEGDGVYSLRHTFTCSAGTPIRLRVSLLAARLTTQYDALSTVLTIPCVRALTPASCQAAVDLQSEAQTRYERTVETGVAPEAAREELLAWLGEQPGVAEAGTATRGLGVWIAHRTGVLGVVEWKPSGTRGSGDAEDGASAAPLALDAAALVGARSALLVDPLATGAPDEVPTEVALLGAALTASTCPAWTVRGPLTGPLATLAELRGLARYGMVAVASHGDTYFRDLSPARREAFGWPRPGSQEVLWTGEPIDCDALAPGPASCFVDAECPAGEECIATHIEEGRPVGQCFDARRADLLLGRAVLGVGTYGILPAFAAAYAGEGLPRSLVYLGACRTLAGGGLASALFGAGAAVVAGWSGAVTDVFARDVGAEWLRGVAVGGQAAGAVFETPPVDPDGGARFRLFGSTTLSAGSSELLGASFEDGLSGWTVDGDVRSVLRLGATTPYAGRAMALVSTGLGRAGRRGTLRQPLCLAAAARTLTFRWKLYSEELPLHCGTVFQDRFVATLRGESGEVALVDITIDDLCAPTACDGCGAHYGPIYDSDVDLDQGAAMTTEWREVRADIRALAGRGPVELVFGVSDLGDSTFDTAVLVDAIEIE